MKDSIFFVDLLHMIRILMTGLFGLFLCLNFIQARGDAVLQAREARLQAAQQRQGRLRSSLSNVSNIDGDVKLIDPAKGGNLFSLVDAIRKAEKESFRMKNAMMHVEKAKSRIHLASTFKRFQVDLKSGFNKAGTLGEDAHDTNDRRVAAGNPATFYTVNDRKLADLSHLEDVFHIGVEANYPLLDGGQGQSKYDMASLEEEIARVEQVQIRQELYKEVSEVYSKMILTREKLDVASLRVEQARFGVAREEKNPNRDSRLPALLLAARLNLEKELQEEFSLRNELRYQESRFRTLVGLKEGEDFSVDKNSPTRAFEETLEGLIKIARNESPKVKKIQLKQKILEKKTRAIQSPKLPDVDVFADTHYARLADRSDLHELRFKFGLKFDMNFLDGGRTRAKHQINNHEKKQAENSLLEATRMVEDRIRFLYNQFLDYKGRIPISQNHVKLARQVLYEAEERFQRRQISNQELLSHRIKYKEAVLAYYQVIQSLMDTKLDLYAEAGRLNLNVFG